MKKKETLLRKIENYQIELENISNMSIFEEKNYKFTIFRNVVEEFFKKVLYYNPVSPGIAVSMSRDPTKQQIRIDRLNRDIIKLKRELETEKRKLVEFGIPKKQKDYIFLQKSVTLNLKIINFSITVRDTIFLVLGAMIGLVFYLTK